MTRDDFWRLIESIDRAALADGDEDAAIAPLESRLSAMPASDMESFEEHLSQCLYALDGQPYAAESGDSGDSDDGFLYARCWVVAQGRQTYEDTLRDATLMPKTLEQWCEALLYPHRRAWAATTGVDESEWTFDSSVSYESGSNEALWRR
jgi:hypothetical protein